MIRVFTKEGQLKTKSVGVTGSYAPSDASYIVVSLDTSLTDERRLQVASDFSLTDGGANNDITLSLNNTTVVPGTYGNTTTVGAFTVDAKGRLIGASNVAISYPVVSVSDTNSIDLTLAATVLSADLRYQNSTTVNLSVNASGLKADVNDNTSIQKVEIVKNSGAVVGTRKQLNFIEGSNTTITIADDGGNDQVDITIASAGSVTGTGVANYVAYWDGVSSLTGESAFQYDATNNTLSVGGVDSMTVNGAAITTRFATHAADGLTEVNAEFHKYGATAGAGGTIYFGRARGSLGAATIVQNGDTLAYIGVSGYDGTDYALGGYLKWTVDAAPGNNDMPTGFALGLSPDGTQTPVDVFTISSAGVAALSNTLSVVTSVRSPIIIGSTSASGTITIRATSNATDGDILFETDPTTERARILSTGEFILGATTLVASEYLSIQKSQNAATFMRIKNATSGTAATTGITLTDSGNLNLNIYNLSAGFTTSGIQVADTAVIFTSNTKAGGLNIGTTGAHQFSFWTNNTERARILSTGEFLVGYNTLASTETFGFQKNQNAATFALITNTTSGTAARALLYVSNSATAATGLSIETMSAGYTTAGIREADAAVIASSKTNGLNIGTGGAQQMSFWTNSVKRVEVSSAGQFIAYAKGTTTSTSTSVTFTSAHYGLEFLWSPSGTATATLPANGAAAGSWFIVTLLTNQTVTISAATADTLITVNDTAADSVAFSTAGQKIGASVKFISNGSVWIAINLSTGFTMTVAT